MRWRHALDWQRARLLRLFQSRGWHCVRGHDHFSDWLDRRLGISPREASALLRIVPHLSELPATDAAWRSGQVSAKQAEKITRVASAATDADWVKFLRFATDKRLDVELAAHAALRVHLGDDGWLDLTKGLPCWDAPMTSLRLRWADVFLDAAKHPQGDSARPGGSCNSVPKPLEAPPLRNRARHPARPLRPATPRQFVFEAPADAAAEFREAMRRVLAESQGQLDAAGCLMAMIQHFATVHVVPSLQGKDNSSRTATLRRDGWICAMPHCRRRVTLEAHHVIYRSRGGGNQKWNLLTLCYSCHRLEHAGKLHIVSIGVRDERGGWTPMIQVSVGDPSIRSKEHAFRDGIRIPRLPDAPFAWRGHV